MTAAHQMKVDVKNDLPSPVIDVHDQTITAVGDAVLARQLVGHKRDGREPQGVIGLDVQEGRHVPFRHDEEVDRRAGVNILNGHQHVILIHLDAWPTVGDDVAKNALCHQAIQRARSALPRGLGVFASRLFLEAGHGLA